MSRARAARVRKRSRSPKQVSVLERLKSGEDRVVLHRLLDAHPELRAEAEQVARSLLASVDFAAIADEVEDSVDFLTLDDLDDRAGRHGGSYTGPSEAASDLLDETVEPFLANLQRQMDLGLNAEAVETCKGILLGLYRTRNGKGSELLEWVPDFPEDTAAHAVRLVAGAPEGSRVGGRAMKRCFNVDFVHHHIPEWRELVARVLERALRPSRGSCASSGAEPAGSRPR